VPLRHFVRFSASGATRFMSPQGLISLNDRADLNVLVEVRFASSHSEAADLLHVERTGSALAGVPSQHLRACVLADAQVPAAFALSPLPHPKLSKAATDPRITNRYLYPGLGGIML